MTRTDTPVYTIGHSSHSIEEFLHLLTAAGIDAIADVRSNPFSRWRPHFNGDCLRRELSAHEISYVPLGAALGGRGTAHAQRDEHGRVHYSRIAHTQAFQEGLRRVRLGSERMRLALMCAENDPLECHRGILGRRPLAALGVNVLHIHAGGRIEPHREAGHRVRRLPNLA